jgi:hypothetical protein
MANGGIIGQLVTITPTKNYPAAAASYADLKLFCQDILNNSNPGSAVGVWSLSDVYENRKANTWIGSYSQGLPTVGSTQIINSVSLGSYDFVRKPGGTISSFTYSDYFTDTNDSRSSIIIFDGNVTVDPGVTIVPRNRKLFTCIYVNGNLTVNGSIEMTLRGANHSAPTGSNVAAGAIRIAPGTFSPSVTNPEIPAAGGSGGAGTGVNPGVGNQGATGTAGGTGGGSGGGAANHPTNVGGAGAPGTSFSGGPGGSVCAAGNPPFGTSGAGSPSGGAGGFGAVPGSPPSSLGYAYAGGGNSPTADTNVGATEPDQNPYWGRVSPGPRSFPGVTMGYGSTAGAPHGGSPTGGIYGNSSPLGNFYGGTGGVLIIMVTGTLSGNGTIRADGYYGTGGEGGIFSRAGAGAGSVTVICASNSSSITPSASCGPSQGPFGEKPGGAGTARILIGTL